MGTVFHNYNFLTHSPPALLEERIPDENSKHSNIQHVPVSPFWIRRPAPHSEITVGGSVLSPVKSIDFSAHWYLSSFKMCILWQHIAEQGHRNAFLKWGNLQTGFSLRSTYVKTTMAPLHFFPRQFNLRLLLSISEASSPKVNKAELWVSLKHLSNEFNIFGSLGSTHAFFALIFCGWTKMKHSCVASTQYARSL